MIPSRWGRLFWAGPALGAALIFFVQALPAESPVAPDASDQADSAAAQAVDPTLVPTLVPTPAWASRLGLQDKKLSGMDWRIRDMAASVHALQTREQASEPGLRAAQADLSRVAEALGRASSALDEQARALARLDASVAGLSERVDSLDGSVRGLNEAQAGAGVRAAEEQERRRSLSAEMDSFKTGLDGVRDGLARQTEGLKAAQSSLERLDSMDELLTMVQHDVQTNDEELVEAKQALQRLEAPPEDGPGWWHAVLTYRYLPAVAAGLAVVALGIEAFQR